MQNVEPDDSINEPIVSKIAKYRATSSKNSSLIKLLECTDGYKKAISQEMYLKSARATEGQRSNN
ncbi:hypothetical protein V1477_018912 [Vespula maculifrons]|uniref:Uncharacterized protein n=1 Tax=Vespula maculifrons TaxID=7453 RepID=A0ABD2AVG4_VESMC